MICLGSKRFFELNCLIILIVAFCHGQQQAWSVNAIPDENRNWKMVGDSSNPQPTGRDTPMRVNGNIGSLSNEDPSRFNNQGNRGQGDRFNSPHPIHFMDGSNGTSEFKGFVQDVLGGKNESSRLKGILQNAMDKGKQAMNKMLDSLQSNNESIVVIRQPRQFMPSACAQEMMDVQTDCFSKSGYSMDAFFHTLRNGSFSTTSVIDGLRKELCDKRQPILDCAIPIIISKRDKPPCLDVHDYNFGQEMALKGLRILQDVCEKGLLPPPPTCVPMVNREMQRCYNKVGFSPDMFISNDTDVEGAVIGKDLNSANRFCGLRKELYACMRLVLMNCPHAADYLLMSGHDQDAIEKSIDVLCDNKKVYLDGLSCFQTPSETVHNCIDVMSSQSLDLEANQMLKSMSKQDFHKEFCKIRVQHMECDTTAWKESCHEVTVGLKNEFQCAMLPGICHNITEIDDILHNKVCKREAYLQALRAPFGNSGSSLMSWFISTIIGVGICLLCVF